MNDSRASVSIPASVYRMIQNIKKIVDHHNDEDVFLFIFTEWVLCSCLTLPPFPFPFSEAKTWNMFSPPTGCQARDCRVIDTDIPESFCLRQVLKENHQLVPHLGSPQYREQNRASPRRDQQWLLKPHPLDQVKHPQAKPSSPILPSSSMHSPSPTLPTYEPKKSPSVAFSGRLLATHKISPTTPSSVVCGSGSMTSAGDANTSSSSSMSAVELTSAMRQDVRRFLWRERLPSCLGSAIMDDK